MKRTFSTSFRTDITIEIDDSLKPDDKWRATFYDLYTLREMAEHIAWNRVMKRFPSVEGIASEDEDKFRVLSTSSEKLEEWDDVMRFTDREPDQTYGAAD